MTRPEDPPRWSDGADTPATLGSLLSAAKRDVATDAELSELGARLEPMLNPPPGTPSGPLFAKLAAGGALALLGLGAVMALLHSRPAVRPAASAAPTTVVHSAAASAPSPEPGLRELPAAATAAAPAPVNDALGPPSAEAKKSAVGAASRASNTVDAQAEASLLEQARSALAANPARALNLTQQHAQQFPHGLLVQEREVIAITALRRLGRTTEAEARAARFDARYPHSAHQQAVDRSGAQ